MPAVIARLLPLLIVLGLLWLIFGGLLPQLKTILSKRGNGGSSHDRTRIVFLLIILVTVLIIMVSALLSATEF